MDDELLTIKEVAGILKMTRKGVYDLMGAGRLPYLQVGLQRGRRIRRSALESFLRNASRDFTEGTDRGYNDPHKAPMPTLGAAFKTA